MKPCAAGWLSRLIVGNKAIAVPTQAMARTTSRAAATASWFCAALVAIKAGSASSGALIANAGIEVTIVTKYSQPASRGRNWVDFMTRPRQVYAVHHVNGELERCRMVDEKSRRPLTRGQALHEAVLLADAEGLESVSMRNLAARLGVVPMALYKHVANKEDLLDGMVAQLVSEYRQPGTGLRWKLAVRARILSARQVLHLHPWAQRLIETRIRRTPPVLAYMNSLSGTFIEGGVSVRLTHHAMHALGHRIWGFSPEAFNDPDALSLPDNPDKRAHRILEIEAAYSDIAAIARDSASQGGCDADREFEFGLDLILDQVERIFTESQHVAHEPGTMYSWEKP